jgi:tungstate transport system permease protein
MQGAKPMWESFEQAFQLIIGADPELRHIILTTLRMSFTSTAIAALLGTMLGILLGSREFWGKRLILRFTNTLMGLPPVVAGLVVFMLLSRRGPFGELGLLFSVTAMVIAQVILITPIITGLTASTIAGKSPLIMETTRGLGISGFKELIYLFHETRAQLVAIILTGYGRAISEVGAVQLVGGNVQFKTRVMTTAIVLETNRGHFDLALALGIILLIIAFIVNSVAQHLQGGKHA